MARPWVLTLQAEQSLKEIADWTRDVFGPRQAAAYAEDLIKRCEEIAQGRAMVQDCRRVIDPGLPADLRMTRSGQHIIVFLEIGDRIVIVDVLHARSDLPARLQDLE